MFACYHKLAALTSCNLHLLVADVWYHARLSQDLRNLEIRPPRTTKPNTAHKRGRKNPFCIRTINKRLRVFVERALAGRTPPLTRGVDVLNHKHKIHPTALRTRLVGTVVHLLPQGIGSEHLEPIHGGSIDAE